MADSRTDVVVIRFGGRRMPGALADLPVVDIAEPADVDAVTENATRLIVLGENHDLATVLTRLLRTDRLGVEVAHLRRLGDAHRVKTATAQRVPLIRDETAQVLVGTAFWLPEQGRTIHGEGIVDDTVLFDGDVTGVRIEPTPTVPGLRASLLTGRLRPKRWVAGRAAQLGTTGAVVVLDGVPAGRPVRRSTFYRHTEGWLRVS
jgi:hypothetical protein